MRRENYPRHRRPASNNQNDLLEYRVSRSTHFGSYVAVVKVDQREGKQWIYLYEGEPEEYGLWGLFKLEHDPVCESVGGKLTDVNATITKMITEWELMLFEKHRTEEAESFLEIDYFAELKKRRQRLNPEQTNQEEPTTHNTHQEIKITDWQHQEEEVDPAEELAKKHGGNANSYRNLVQFRDQKKKSS